MSFLLEIDKTKPIEGFVDKLLFGGQMVLIGMGVVFSVLVLLFLALCVFKVFFHDLPAKKRERKPVAEVSESVKQSTASVKDTQNSDEIIAVIAAAIAAAESENDGLKFRVVSFKRK